MFSPLLGKYRDLILFIGVFLLIDAAVSAINIYTSHQIEADAGRINMAARLSAYSQQLTKALLTLDMELRSNAPVQTSLAQVSEARLAFADVLAQLQESTGKQSFFAFVEAKKLRQDSSERLHEIARLWEPIEREVEPLLHSERPDAEVAAQALQKAVNRNNRLTQVADDLSVDLENLAREKTSTARNVQLGAILLAFANFAFILFKFIARLMASDRQATLAREENERILGSVREGLFLLTRERLVGSQRSGSLDTLFGRPLASDQHFHALLGELCAPEHAQAAEDYIDLLFNRKVKPALLEQLNPLKEIELLKGGHGKTPSHLSFEFTQVRENGEVVALLVTVFDVSQKVRLERELAGAEARAKSEVTLLLGILDHDPQEVAAFLARARDNLQQVNDDLQGIDPERHSYAQLINRVARVIHGLKGEAGVLGCTSIVQEIHDFEDKLQTLRGRRGLAGDDLIPVAVALNELLGEVLKLEAVVNRVQRFAAGRGSEPGNEDPLAGALQRLEQYALQVAEDLNKQVRVEISAPPLGKLPAALAGMLREAVPQLVRNAIAHGIESPEERSRLGKPATGLVRIELENTPDGGLTMTVHDDGRGISPEHLRQVLVDKGGMNPDTASRLTDAEVVAKLFEPGFSSLDKACVHAGRGDGLSVVKECLHELGARLRISTLPNSHTRFILQIKPA
jgi:signal transduction histidine kinase